MSVSAFDRAKTREERVGISQRDSREKVSKETRRLEGGDLSARGMRIRADFGP
jgi:hypothetical protein